MTLRDIAAWVVRLGYPFDFVGQGADGQPILPPTEFLDMIAEEWYRAEQGIFGATLEEYRLMVYDETGVKP